MEYLTIVAMLALVQYIAFGITVGRARGRTGVAAPATSGHEEFDRYFRVHQNTLEQLVVFLPGLLAFGIYIDAHIGAGLGVIYLIGRQIYLMSYTKDPASRGLGFALTFLPSLILVVGGIVGAVMGLM